MGRIFKRKDSPNKWRIRYSKDGQRFEECTGSDRRKDAIELLRRKEGDIARGLPVSPKMDRLTFAEAATDVINDYRTNGKRSLAVVERKIQKHLMPFFGKRRMSTITTTDVRAYVHERQTVPSVLVRKAHRVVRDDGERVAEPEVRRCASNAQINRELALLKRAFNLAIQGGRLHAKPHIPMLRESSPRSGFFEPEQYRAVLRHLPEEVRPIIEFGYETGWRIASEVLPLEWRQVDFAAGEVRLDAGTTKNGDGRVFPFTEALRALLDRLHQQHQHVARRQFGRVIESHVFVRMVAEGRGGPLVPRRILSFNKAWKTACAQAGCPGRLPHDLRRTAVRNLVRAGIPERVAMQLTGHKTRSVFERYNIVSDGDLREAARRLDVFAGVAVGE